MQFSLVKPTSPRFNAMRLPAVAQNQPFVSLTQGIGDQVHFSSANNLEKGLQILQRARKVEYGRHYESYRFYEEAATLLENTPNPPYGDIAEAYRILANINLTGDAGEEALIKKAIGAAAQSPIEKHEWYVRLLARQAEFYERHLREDLGQVALSRAILAYADVWERVGTSEPLELKDMLHRLFLCAQCLENRELIEKSEPIAEAADRFYNYSQVLRGEEKQSFIRQLRELAQLANPEQKRMEDLTLFNESPKPFPPLEVQQELDEAKVISLAFKLDRKAEKLSVEDFTQRNADLQKALGIYRKIYGTGDRRLASTLMDLGKLYRNQGRDAEAKAYCIQSLQECLQAWKQKQACYKPIIDLNLSRLRDIYRAANEQALLEKLSRLSQYSPGSSDFSTEELFNEYRMIKEEPLEELIDEIKNPDGSLMSFQDYRKIALESSRQYRQKQRSDYFNALEQFLGQL